MNVVMVSRVTMNPYVHLLGGALEEVEPGLTCTYQDAFDPSVVAHWRGKADVFHLHWPEVLLRSRSRLRSSRKLADLVVALAQARQASIALVYTAHNVQPHDDAGLLERLAAGALYRMADAVHVHDDEARRELLAHHRPRRVAVIAHGSYIGAYPDTCSRGEARQKLGMPLDAFVFLALGQVRPYKGLDDLIAAFRALPGANLRLLIAGHPHDPGYGATLAREAALDDRIRLDLQYVADDAIQYCMRAADVCVLPYRSGTTSGAAILALSFGRPVIAPDVWPFRPLLAGGGGMLYADQHEGLQQALDAAVRMDVHQAGAAALALARSLDWRSIARRHLEVYKEVAKLQMNTDAHT